MEDSSRLISVLAIYSLLKFKLYWTVPSSIARLTWWWVKFATRPWINFAKKCWKVIKAVYYGLGRTIFLPYIMLKALYIRFSVRNSLMPLKKAPVPPTLSPVELKLDQILNAITGKTFKESMQNGSPQIKCDTWPTHLISLRSKSGEHVGFGFVIARHGGQLLLTAAHVIQEIVKSGEGSLVANGQHLKMDLAWKVSLAGSFDLVGIKLPSNVATSLKVKSLKLAKTPGTGTALSTYGYINGEITRTVGVISGRSSRMRVKHTASTQRGHCGSPMILGENKVCAIHFESDGLGYNYAFPLDFLVETKEAINNYTEDQRLWEIQQQRQDREAEDYQAWLDEHEQVWGETNSRFDYYDGDLEYRLEQSELNYRNLRSAQRAEDEERMRQYAVKDFGINWAEDDFDMESYENPYSLENVPRPGERMQRGFKEAPIKGKESTVQPGSEYDHYFISVHATGDYSKNVDTCYRCGFGQPGHKSVFAVPSPVSVTKERADFPKGEASVAPQEPSTHGPLKKKAKPRKRTARKLSLSSVNSAEASTPVKESTGSQPTTSAHATPVSTTGGGPSATQGQPTVPSTSTPTPSQSKVRETPQTTKSKLSSRRSQKSTRRLVSHLLSLTESLAEDPKNTATTSSLKKVLNQLKA